MGRREGFLLGDSFGRTRMPLIMRQHALSSGICPVCDFVHEEGTKAEYIGGETNSYC